MPTDLEAVADFDSRSRHLEEAKAALERLERGAKAANEPTKVSEVEAKKETLRRFKTVTMAFYGYYEVTRELPPAAIVSKDGKPLLSWRVLVLPYLGHERLFHEFRLSEPWDSPHNIKLLAKMPEAFAPVGSRDPNSHMTPWQVFTGPGTIFEEGKACRLRDIEDGTTRTILMTEADQMVPWTRPEDLPYDAKKPLPKLGHTFPGIFLFATADGDVHLGRRQYQETAFRSAVLRNDGMYFDFEKELLAKEQP